MVPHLGGFSTHINSCKLGVWKTLPRNKGKREGRKKKEKKERETQWTRCGHPGGRVLLVLGHPLPPTCGPLTRQCLSLVAKGLDSGTRSVAEEQQNKRKSDRVEKRRTSNSNINNSSPAPTCHSWTGLSSSGPEESATTAGNNKKRRGTTGSNTRRAVSSPASNRQPGYSFCGYSQCIHSLFIQLT